MEIELKIPDNIKLLEKDKVMAFSPKQKEKYYDKVILDILRANPTGVSVSEIEKATGFYGRTVRDHLEKLAAVGEVFSITRSHVAFYFPSGGSEGRPLTIKSKTREGVFYVANKLSNQRGKFVYIQQKEMDDYRALRVKGGILVAEDDVKEFIKELNTYCGTNRGYNDE